MDQSEGQRQLMPLSYIGFGQFTIVGKRVTFLFRPHEYAEWVVGDVRKGVTGKWIFTPLFEQCAALHGFEVDSLGSYTFNMRTIQKVYIFSALRSGTVRCTEIQRQ